MGDVLVAAVVDVVENQAVQADAVLFERGEAEQGVVDAAEPPAGTRMTG